MTAMPLPPSKTLTETHAAMDALMDTPEKPADKRAAPSSARADDVMVPVLNRGPVLDLVSDTAGGADKLARRIARGLNYIRRGELLAIGEVVRVQVRGEELSPGLYEDLSYDEWRAFPACPAGRSGRVEILDPVSQPVAAAVQIVKQSSSLPCLRLWSEAEEKIAADRPERRPVLAALAGAIQRLRTTVRKNRN
jgi:hypothetical protein